MRHRGPTSSCCGSCEGFRVRNSSLRWPSWSSRRGRADLVSGPSLCAEPWAQPGVCSHVLSPRPRSLYCCLALRAMLSRGVAAPRHALTAELSEVGCWEQTPSLSLSVKESLGTLSSLPTLCRKLGPRLGQRGDRRHWEVFPRGKRRPAAWVAPCCLWPWTPRMGPGWLVPRGNENTGRSDLLAAVGGQPWSPLSGGLAQPLDMDTDPTR